MRIPRTFQNGRASIKTIELILRVSGFLGQAAFFRSQTLRRSFECMHDFFTFGGSPLQDRRPDDRNRLSPRSRNFTLRKLSL
jgi:hypothetical protein